MWVWSRALSHTIHHAAAVAAAAAVSSAAAAGDSCIGGKGHAAAAAASLLHAHGGAGWALQPTLCGRLPAAVLKVGCHHLHQHCQLQLPAAPAPAAALLLNTALHPPCPSTAGAHTRGVACGGRRSRCRRPAEAAGNGGRMQFPYILYWATIRARWLAQMRACTGIPQHKGT